MRWLITTVALCLSAPILIAQQQERTLIDRLLRPDMELQNNAQGKKFVTHSAVIERRGAVGTFFLQPRPPEKSFADSRTVSTKQFAAATAKSSAMTTASVAEHQVNLPPPVTSSNVVDLHSAVDAPKQLAGINFGGQRAFREQGKSQKSLDRRNPPLTIEQVRELLNKNK